MCTLVTDKVKVQASFIGKSVLVISGNQVGDLWMAYLLEIYKLCRCKLVLSL